MKRIFALTATLFFALATVLSAQNLSNLAAAFVDPGIGARAQALGGAFTAIAQGGSAVFWNAAGLAGNEAKSVEFSHLNQFSLIPYNAVAGAIPLGQNHALGIGLLTSGDRQMRETTAVAGYALNGEDIFPGMLSHFKIGASLKFHTSRFGQNGFDPEDYPLFSEQEVAAAQDVFVSGDASGFGLDLGMIYTFNEKLLLGLSWRNLLSSIAWENGQSTYDEGIPQGLTFGLAYFARPGFLLTTDYDNSLSADRFNRLKFGAERMILNRFALRGGIGQALAANSDRDYTLGLGLMQEITSSFRIDLDYAFHIHPLADSHRFSLGLRF